MEHLAKRIVWRPLLLFASPLAAAAEKTANAVLVADSRGLNGIMAWWTNLFNESHFYFALLTVIVIPVAGIILGTLADVIMGRIGINLKSRELREG